VLEDMKFGKFGKKCSNESLRKKYTGNPGAVL
jgi:hypothetical protein